MENKKEETEYTTIRVSVKLWKYLNDGKVNPSQTPEDVIWNLIKFEKGENEI